MTEMFETEKYKGGYEIYIVESDPFENEKRDICKYNECNECAMYLLRKKWGVKCYDTKGYEMRIKGCKNGIPTGSAESRVSTYEKAKFEMGRISRLWNEEERKSRYCIPVQKEEMRMEEDEEDEEKEEKDEELYMESWKETKKYMRSWDEMEEEEEEMIWDDEIEIKEKEKLRKKEKCKYYAENRCIFGSSCFNIH